jgi:hypothetical protein
MERNTIMGKETKKNIGKRIAQLKEKYSDASPYEKRDISKEIRRLENMKMPGTVLYIPDNTFFDAPRNKGGHLYLVDEFSGQRIAVNRISHSKAAKNKVALGSMPRNSEGTPSFAQLDVIYTGKKGKSLKLNKQREPHSGTIKPTPMEKYEVRQKAIRDSIKKKKWGSKK